VRWICVDDDARRQLTARVTRRPVTHYRIPPVKSPPGREFTGKILPRPATAQAGTDFTGKLSARVDFYGAGGILIRRRHINSVIIFSRANFSWGRHFNVTPAGVTVPCSDCTVPLTETSPAARWTIRRSVDC